MHRLHRGAHPHTPATAHGYHHPAQYYGQAYTPPPPTGQPHGLPLMLHQGHIYNQGHSYPVHPPVYTGYRHHPHPPSHTPSQHSTQDRALQHIDAIMNQQSLSPDNINCITAFAAIVNTSTTLTATQDTSNSHRMFNFLGWAGLPSGSKTHFHHLTHGMRILQMK